MTIFNSKFINRYENACNYRVFGQHTIRKMGNCFVKIYKIGILVAGNSPVELQGRHGTYDAMMRTMIGGKNTIFKSWDVYKGEFPDKVDGCDGWIITGSKSSAYETDDWILNLRNLIIEIYAAKVPLVGICFGHQVIAKALGGQVVDTGEFVMGIREYDFQGKKYHFPATHGDQVKKLPPKDKNIRLTVLGTAGYCKYMALKYGETVFSTQVHPEFTREYLVDAMALRNAEPEKRIHSDSKIMVDYINKFLLRK